LHDQRPVHTAQFSRYLSLPWVESPFFEAELADRNDLTEDQTILIRQYNRLGYVILENVITEELAERIKREVVPLFNPDVAEGPASYYRVQDAWKTSEAVRELALNERILQTLRMLYGREPVPFQTLNFLYGSQQTAHPDAPLFNSLPPRYMCGVWIALEDVDRDNGPLFYYPGSHKLSQYYPEDFLEPGDNPDDLINDPSKYPRFIYELMQTFQLAPQELHIRMGDALIWASNLVHGGMPRIDATRTRWSQVTHCFFKDCIYYVPLYSNAIAGEWFLRDVVDLRGGGKVPQTFNGVPFRKTLIGNGRYRISLAPQTMPTRDDQAEAKRLKQGVVRLREGSRLMRLVRRLRRKLSFIIDGLSRATSRARGQRFREAVLPQVESTAMVYYIDLFEENVASFTIVGWAFLPGTSLAASRDIQIALRSTAEVYILDCRKVARPDVAAAHQLSHPECGFELVHEKQDLRPGRYRVGLLIKQDDRAPAMRFTDRTVAIL